jgi:hypothetical protein
MVLLIENVAEGNSSFPAEIVLIDSLNVSKKNTEVRLNAAIEMMQDCAPK